GDVREFARQRLPEYMVPSQVVELAELPLTPAGKLDRRALPAPGHSGTAAGDEVESRNHGAILEGLVREVFADVLGVPQVGVHDDFFRLGGHSLLAVTLVTRLAEKGVSTSVREVFATPTVSGIVSRLSFGSLGDSLLGPLLPIRTDGGQEPIFCIHPAGGLSWCYRPLTRFVPAGVPLYGLQAAGLDDAGQPAGSIEEMAAAYVDLIRSVQPTGPYHLLGFSFGGIPAHEIAVQLTAAGESVAELVILDAFPTTPSGPPAPVEEDEGEGEGEGEIIVMDVEASLRRAAARVREEVGDLLGGVSDEEVRHIAEVFRNNSKLRQAHRLKVFGGDLLLISAGVRKEGRNPDGTLWRPYVRGEITEVELPCAHSDMMLPDMLRQAWEIIAERRAGER
ncbi:alpha/beta fold hydrolase, partial [Actinoplanes sp. NPDC020271]|uniref:alpha/beta fold hydrolase n=1 Tax=Actinoplanes sp. NPDC020271 TaxID=3363896 RepID=UPI00379C61D5